MKCSECNTKNPESKKFCRRCGAKLSLRCPECGSEILPDDDFCGDCGKNLTLPAKSAPSDLSFDEKIAKIQRYLPEGLSETILSQRDRIEGERKEVTVMFCDMEGFTALTERLGPEEAYSIIDDVYEILIHKVHDYEGTVNEMTGDGIVALFGAPIALEDAPQRAVRSGLAIHREMTKFSDRMRKERTGALPLKMRIGIHTGPVVVGTLGNDLRVDFKAVGDTVNLASRMEELARPGTTYVTHDTFKRTEGLFRFEALGGQDIKGKEEPVNVYQVIVPSTRRTRFDVSAERGLTPFVGRERELELLLDGFERAKAGRGQAFSIVAEAGLGKSRLLYEFRKAVTNEDITFLEGKSLSYSRGIAYHPVIDMLKSNFDIHEDDGISQVVEKVKQGLITVEADEPSTLPYLLDVLSVEKNGIEKASLSPETRKERIVQTLRKVVLRSSELRPLIMTFEDLHWVDKSSEDVFRTFLEGIAGARVLLIFTYRPEFVHSWGGKSYHSQLNLVRLSNRESLAMLRCLLGTENIDKRLEELVLEKTEGIPFYIEELVKSLKEMDIIQMRDDKYHLAKRTQEVTIPSTIQDVIMARVDSLPEGAKEVLQTGALIDREFTYEIIKQVAGLSEQELLVRLSSLKDAELLYERGIYPATTYIFKHALTQEVAHRGLLEKKKRETHEKIGNVIEDLNQERLEEHCEILAYHYIRSDNKAKALTYLHAAHQKAARASAMEDAEQYFEQGMDLLDTLPENEANKELRISLLVNQWIVSEQFFQIREYQSLLSRYEPLAVSVGNKSLLGRFYYSMGYCQLIFGSFEESIRTSTKAAELFEASGNTEDVAGAYSVMAYGYLGIGDFARALAMKNEVPRHTGSGMDRHFNLAHYVRAACCASTTCSFLGRWDEAVEEGKRALEVAEESSDSGHSCFAASRIANAYTFKGDLNRAIEYGELALKRATAPTFEAWARSSLASAHCRTKQAEKGVEVLAELTAIYRSEGLAGYELLSGGHICDGYLLLRQYDKAKTAAEGLLEVASQCKAKWHIGRALRFLGEVALQTGPANPTPHFEQAISSFKDLNAENELALAYSGMGRYHKLQGETEQARKYLTKALEIFERLGTLIEPDKVREELADLPQ